MMTRDDILQLDGRSLAKALQEDRVTAEEVMVATLDQIEALSTPFHAIVSVRNRDDLLKEARLCDEQMKATTEAIGKLSGIPFAIKDLSNVAGIPTTMGGSPLHSFFNIPSVSDPFVQRIVDQGAIVIGKTNTPELGVGSHTFNKRWGTTVNPYDTTCSAGGSSGGAAVALSTRMLCLADGSDMMGSLRNPAGWNNLYSHRPTAGLIDMECEALPDDVNPLPWPISTAGPMARTPLDLAFLLDIMAESDAFDELFDVDQVEENPTVKGMKIAWLGDWAGEIPMEDGILPLCQDALETFSNAKGVIIVDLSNKPVFDLEKLWNSWTTIRSKIISANFPQLPSLLMRAFLWLAPIREELKWEVGRGTKLSKENSTEAAKVALQWSQRLDELFEEYDALALPTAQCWPFPVEWKYPETIQGTTMATYHKWMEIAMPGSLAGVPCMTIPAGFGVTNGLPMGIQLIGKRGNDVKLLNLAQSYHSTVNWPQRNPPKTMGGSGGVRMIAS